MPNEVEEAMGTAGQIGELVHRALDDVGHLQVEGVRRLPCLEEDVRVLRGTAQHRVVRGQCPRAVRVHEPIVDHRSEVPVVERLDLVDLV
jgi:hypothetical protein